MGWTIVEVKGQEIDFKNSFDISSETSIRLRELFGRVGFELPTYIDSDILREDLEDGKNPLVSGEEVLAACDLLLETLSDEEKVKWGNLISIIMSKASCNSTVAIVY